MKIYVDLDDTLVDFNRAVAMLGHAAGLPEDALQKEKDAMFQAIVDAGPGFWANMPWRKDGMILWEALKPYDPVLLSSPGRDGMFRTYAEKGKKLWVQKNIPGTILFMDPDKEIYAERDAVLIDNDQGNIDHWIERNGTGILYKDAASALATLKTLIKELKVMSSRISVTSSLHYAAAYMLFRTALEEDRMDDFMDLVDKINRPEQLRAMVDAFDDPRIKNYLQNKFGPESKGYIDRNFNVKNPGLSFRRHEEPGSQKEILDELKAGLKEALPAIIKMRRDLKPEQIREVVRL